MKKLMLFVALLGVSASSVSAENKFSSFFSKLANKLFGSMESKENVKRLLAKSSEARESVKKFIVEAIDEVKVAVASTEDDNHLPNADRRVKVVQLNLDKCDYLERAIKLKRLNDAAEKFKKARAAMKNKQKTIVV